jgi:protein-tyrosine phosphatase
MNTEPGDRVPEIATPTVLFLCTGNYYRSRFAEELFNSLAAQLGLSARSTSRGFRPSPQINPGTISEVALAGLRARGVVLAKAPRFPAAVAQGDFLRHLHCIAMSEWEHRPMMDRLFPGFAVRIRYWHAEDLAWETPEKALANIEREVRDLLDRLRD